MITIFLAAQMAVADGAVAPTIPIDSACKVQQGPPNTVLAGDIVFICWSRAVRLGPVGDFAWKYNTSTQSTAVVLQSAGHQRVLLISPTGDKVPLVEDVTGDLARLAGRYAGAGIDGLQVDLSRFASDGSLALSSSAAGAQAASSTARALPALGVAPTFDSGPHTTRAAALFARPATSPTGSPDPAKANQ